MSVPNWTPDGGGEPVAAAMGIQYDDLRYIGHVGPQNNILAIPNPACRGPYGRYYVSIRRSERDCLRFWPPERATTSGH